MNLGDRDPASDSRVRALLAALVLTLAPAAQAQLRLDDVQPSVLRPSAPGNQGSLYVREDIRSPDGTASPGNFFAGARWLAGSVQLEVPRDSVTGQYTRPRFVAGLPSEALRNWLNSSGLAAERCLLPMLRARTRMTSEGDVDGTLWLQARCTFY